MTVITYRAGRPPTGPRPRNWTNHMADTATWVLLGIWLGALIGA